MSQRSACAALAAQSVCGGPLRLINARQNGHPKCAAAMSPLRAKRPAIGWATSAIGPIAKNFRNARLGRYRGKADIEQAAFHSIMARGTMERVGGHDVSA